MGEKLEYLAFKNWAKYQSGKKGWDWIKDYVNQNDDEDLSGLSLFERGLLQELRRVRGRSGKNIHNTVTHIAGAIHAKSTDRPHIRHAVATLLARGVLILTNEPVDSLEERRREEKRGDNNVETDKTPEPTSVPATPVILELQTPTDYELERKKENEIIEAVFEHYCISTEKNRLTYRLSPQRKKIGITRLRDCLKLTKGDYDKAAGLLREAIDKLSESDWHMGRDTGTKGKRYCDWEKNLFKSYEAMERWFNA